MTPAKNILLLGLRWHNGLIRAIVHEAAERHWHINLGASLHGTIPRGWTGDGIIGTYGVEPNRLERLLRRVLCRFSSQIGRVFRQSSEQSPRQSLENQTLQV